MTFEEELRALIVAHEGQPFEKLERAVIELHRRHDREVPPPVTGTMELTEPPDSFGD